MAADFRAYASRYIAAHPAALGRDPSITASFDAETRRKSKMRRVATIVLFGLFSSYRLFLASLLSFSASPRQSSGSTNIGATRGIKVMRLGVY
jgi:hypothetical protein